MDVGVPELVIILVLVVLLFGVGRISKIAGELGSGVRAFREGLQGGGSGDGEKAASPPANEQPAAKEEPAAKVEMAINSETDEPASVDHRS
jgi:sec-independent protein translocase protein TatA